MTARHCTHCQSTELEEGVVWQQPGRGAYDGVGSWYSGPNELGVFGGLTNFRKRKRAALTVHRSRKARRSGECRGEVAPRDFHGASIGAGAFNT